MIPIEFLKEHKVKDVRSTSWNGGTTLTVIFEDDRTIEKLLIDSSYDNLIEVARYTILENSLPIQRKKKINKIIKKSCHQNN